MPGLKNDWVNGDLFTPAAANDMANAVNLAQPVSTPTAIKTAAYTAAVGELVPADAASGGFTVTLPAAPAAGSTVWVKKIDTTTNTVTVQRGNGTDVFNETNGPSLLQLAVPGESVQVQYRSGIWYVMAHSFSVPGLDGRYVRQAPTGVSSYYFLLDALGARSLGIDSVSGAVNSLSLRNSTTGNPVLLFASSLENNASVEFRPKGTGTLIFKSGPGNSLVEFVPIASAVNSWRFDNSTTGNPIVMRALGSDANLSVNFVPKGSGTLQQNGVPVVTTTGSQAISGKTSIDSTGAVTGSTLVSTVATGTAPLTVASTTMVNNLSAQYLGTDGASASTVIGASSIAQRNGAGSLLAGNFVQRVDSYATSAGTTTITAGQGIIEFTGTTTQTAVLPSALSGVGQQFTIINNSTGSVTVQSSTLAQIHILAPGTEAVFTALTATPTTAAHWEDTLFSTTFAAGKALTVNNSLTLAGTDATTMTFPTTNATIARTDAAQTFTGVQTMTSPAITTPTGIVKGDVGLGNVDNTSNATERAATASLTNKDLTSATNTFPTLNQNTSGTAAGLSATLVVGSGGTGVATLTGLVKGNGTSAMSAAVAGTDFIAPGGAAGTPSSLTLTNATGLPVSGITASTSTALGVGSIELGHASDTSLTRSAAGVLAVEGVDLVNLSSNQTLTTKTISAGTYTGAQVVAASSYFQFFNTADRTTNYERLELGYTTNVFTLNSTGAGTGTRRPIVIQSGCTFTVDNFNSTAGTVRVTNSTGGVGVAAFGVTSTYTNSSGLTYSALLNPTMSQTGTGGYTTLLINTTETSNTGSGAKLLIDAQLAGSSKFSVSNAGSVTLADAATLAVGTSTGTKIATATTQKLGFWNASPAVQPTAVADATDAATVITQLNSLLSRLRTIGLIAT